MAICPFVCWLGLGLLGAEDAIDSFPYREAEAARRTWVSSENTPPIEVVEDGGRSVVQLALPFAARPELQRSVIDRRVKLDLTSPGTFALEVAVDQAKAISHLSLYFRSGSGWYSGSAALDGNGWQRLRYSKTGFRTEGQPAGWHQIDGVRIGAWQAQPVNATLRIRLLAAVSHDMAVVLPAGGSGKAAGEIRTSFETARNIGRLLEDIGLGADGIDEASLVRGALGERRVAILPYNPKLSNEATAVLERLVERGGSVLVCFNLPRRLGEVLGFRPGKYIPEDRKGHFAEMRFDASDIAGMPKSIKQASWNIVAAEPAGHNSRVIARWFDDEGKPTGQPAVLLSDRGAFLTHILLVDDPEGKKQFLAALLGRFSPNFWQRMAEGALERAQRVGPFTRLQDLVAGVQAKNVAVTQPCIDAGTKTLAQARDQFQQRAYPQAIELARKANAQLAEAYLRAQPSPAREGRAAWNHSGLGAYPGDWERSAKALEAAGFNMILPNQLWGGSVLYPSEVLPQNPDVERYGDQIAQCVAAAKRHGLEVHVWKVNWRLGRAPAEFVERMRRAGRVMVSAQGEPNDWLCPSHPENFKLEVESMLEVGRKYDVAGLHFDYIRYPGPDYCYCSGCRERFEADTGRKVAAWPADCRTGPLRKQYNDWRCKQITRLVAAVHEGAKKIRPYLKVSAAVFNSYPNCRETIAQDWVAWVKAGYLDFICPMDYTEGDLGFSAMVENQLRLVEGRIPMYPGIGVSTASSMFAPGRVVSQIDCARRAGAAGFTMFEFTGSTADAVLPGIALGAGSQKAVPPHRDGPTRKPGP